MVNDGSVATTDREPPNVPANFRKGAPHTWHQRRRHRVVLKMLQEMNGHVLDYGCGFGDLTYAISQTHSVCGVDLDPDRVAFAAREYHPLEFKTCTAEDAPYPDASFDVVTSIVVLNFLPDASGYLRSVRRLLRPNGHLILACKNLPRVQNWFRGLLGIGPASPNANFYDRSRASVRELLRNEKFEVEREGHFYDPPLMSWKNSKDVVVGTVEQLLSLLRIRETANYFLVVAKKNGN